MAKVLRWKNPSKSHVSLVFISKAMCHHFRLTAQKKEPKFRGLLSTLLIPRKAFFHSCFIKFKTFALDLCNLILLYLGWVKVFERDLRTQEFYVMICHYVMISWKFSQWHRKVVAISVLQVSDHKIFLKHKKLWRIFFDSPALNYLVILCRTRCTCQNY